MHRRWPLVALAAALTLITAPAASGASSDPPAAAGWHGREIRDPLPQRVRDGVARFPRGWSAGGVGRGSGYDRPNGSRRVREVQRRLIGRGYRPGRVDGRFGSRTRAAVIWFQTKHGLPRTGRVDARSIATLRQGPQASTPATGETPIPPNPAQEETGTFAGPAPAATPEQADRTWLVLLVAMTIVGLAAIVWWMVTELRRRPVGAADAGGVDRAQLTAIAPPPAHAPVSVIGYLAVARGADRDRALGTATQTISSWCQGHGWQLTHIVHDAEPASGRVNDRPGLAYALDQIAAGHVAGLVVAHLADLTRSVTELAQLLQWLNQAGAFMIALDYELDTSAAAGELAAGALIQVGNWERGGIADRTAIRASGRDDAELSARISAMRPQGLASQANATNTRGRWDHDPT